MTAAGKATQLPDHLGLVVLIACLVIAVALAASGVLRVVREGRALAARFDYYKELPLRAEFLLACRRLSAAQRAIDTLPVLMARYERALAEMMTARDRVTTMTFMLVGVLRRQFRI